MPKQPFQKPRKLARSFVNQFKPHHKPARKAFYGFKAFKYAGIKKSIRAARGLRAAREG